MKKLEKKSKMSSTSYKILIAGLGNPGEKYATTPHNAGFLVASSLAEKFGLQFSENKKLKSEIAEGKLGNKKIILIKPQTFMNKSGESISLVAKSYKLKAQSSLWVIHDDIDLVLGKIKIVRNRGSAGHKGVEDIMLKLKTHDFVRFRIGIRSKVVPLHRPKTIMNKLVVAALAGKDAKLFTDSVKKCTEAVSTALEENVEKTASIYNQ